MRRMSGRVCRVAMRVGAGGAASAAIQTLLDTAKERLAKIASRQGLQLHDLAKGHLPERAGELAIRGIREVQRDRRRSRCPHGKRFYKLGRILQDASCPLPREPVR